MSDTRHVACFRVAGRDCAVDVLAIAEVLQPMPVTRLPSAPSFVEGVIELRGRFLPVIDLRKRFGDIAATGDGKYIVAPLAGSRVALVVDEVTGVERIPADLVQPPPELAAIRLAPLFLAGVVKWHDRVILLLELESVLTTDEKRALGNL